MTSISHRNSWEQRLDVAPSTNEVLELVREFMANIPAAEWEGLPQALRVPALADPDDVASFAFDIVRYHCVGPTDPLPVAARLAVFLSAATRRIAQISALQ